MTILSKGCKTEITQALDASAAKTIAEWIGSYGVIWNCKVAEQRAAKEAFTKGEIAELPVLNQSCAQFQTSERPWLKLVPSQIRRNAASQYFQAVNAYSRGLRSMPRFKNKYSKKSCLVTNELFDVQVEDQHLVFVLRSSAKQAPLVKIKLGLQKDLVDLPKMIWLSRIGARFFLSYSYTHEAKEVLEPETILANLGALPKPVQELRVMGLDLGVKQAVALSNAKFKGYTAYEQSALLKRDRARKRQQKNLSRAQVQAKRLQTKTGKNAAKVKARLARSSARMANLRRNMTHRVSKQIAELDIDILVVEKLQIKNMTKNVKAKADPNTGQYLPNGKAAKSALNRSILNMAWSQLITYCEYKLKEQGKLLIKLPAHYSSQECQACAYTAKENRISQAKFHCQNCHLQDHADTNAAKVLKKRFIQDFQAGKFVYKTKTVKKIAVRRQTKSHTERIAVSVCGANLRPNSLGSGEEAETSKCKLRSSLL